MSNVIDYPGVRKQAPVRKLATVPPIMAEIIEALVHFQGQAHRDAVCDHIATSRAAEPRRASEPLKREIVAAFDAHLAMVRESRRGRCLFCRPFGEDSYRWGLTPDALRLFAASPASAAAR